MPLTSEQSARRLRTNTLMLRVVSITCLVIGLLFVVIDPGALWLVGGVMLVVGGVVSWAPAFSGRV